MKKVLSLVLLLTMLSCLAVPAFAADAETIVPVVADTTAAPGQDVTLTLSLPEEVAGVGAGNIVVSVADGLEYVSGEWLLKKTMLAQMDDVKLKGVFAYSKATKLSGDVFSVTVKLPATASSSAVFHVTLRLGLTDDATSESLPVAEVTASISVACRHTSYETTWTTDDTYHWHACEGCGEPQEKIRHVFDNACDTTCNVCGYTRKTTHQYSSDWKCDATGHWQTCKICGKRTEITAHTPGAPATEKSAQTCTVCGFVIAPALAHTHVYAKDWSKNATYHWHACTGCDEAKDKAKHIYDSSCDTTCNTCGYVRKITHTYTSWTRDDTSHWHVCTVCGNVADKTAHVYDNSCDAICNECGYVREITHSFGDTWYSDAEGHWTVCTVCGIASVKSAHTPAATASETDPCICSECGYVIAAAVGHTFSEWTLTKLPTLTEEGQLTRSCACGETETLPFPKLTAENEQFAEKLGSIFTPEELLAIANGAAYRFYLAAEPTELNVPDLDGTVISCYNFAFYKTVGDGAPVAVSGLTAPTDVTLTVPEIYRNTDPNTTRTYRVAVLSGGEVTSVLDGTYDETNGTFTFKANGNLTGAFLYADEAHQTQRVDGFPGWLLWTIVGVAAVAGGTTAVLLFLKKKKKAN